MSDPFDYLLQGDVEAAIIGALRDAVEIDDFPGGAPTVSSSWEGYSANNSTKNRWIMVTREGGSLIWPVVDKPRVDIQVIAPTRTIAHDLAQVAQAVILREVEQGLSDHGATITDAKIETGITRVPDKETGSPRYIFALRLTCVPEQ